jgi:secreted trypsin-like serine protease
MLSGQRWIRTALGAVAAIGVVVGGLASPSTAVVNGDSTDVDQFPFLVAIGEKDYGGRGDMYGGRYSQFCGGTLVGPRKVITAAHCLYDSSWEDGELVVGSMGNGALSSLDSTIGVVKSYVIHPAYDSDLILNDIAVITLEADMVGVPYAVPAADDSALVVGGSPAVSAGWGTTDQSLDDDGYPNLFRVAPLTIFPASSCGGGDSYEVNGKRFNGYGVNDSVYAKKQLCAQGYRNSQIVDTCVGDSGGPLLAGTGVEMRLVGIVSWGPPTCATRDPGVYTRIAGYESFLEQQRVSFDPPLVGIPQKPVLVKAVVSARALTVRMHAAANGPQPTAFWAVAKDSAGHTHSCAVYAPDDTENASCVISGLINGERYLVSSFAVLGTNKSSVTGAQAYVPAARPGALEIRRVVVGQRSAVFGVRGFVDNGSEITAKYVRCTALNRPTLKAPVGSNGKATITKMVAGARYSCTAYAVNAVGTSAPSAPVRFLAG